MAPSLPSEDAANLTMPQLLLKTTERTRDLPPESIKTAVGQLNTLLAPYPSMHRLGQQLLKLSDALSLSACLTSYAWPTGGDLPRIKCALVALGRYIDEAGLVTITDAVKSQHLLEILKAVRDGSDSTTSWRSLACEIAMDLLKLDDDELPLFQLEAVKDFPSMAVHLSEYVSRIKQLTTLKALRDIVQERCRRLNSPDWAAAVLQQMGVPMAPASAAPTALAAPPPAAATDMVPVRMSLCPVSEGLPWPVFVAAASAYFRCEVHGPHQPCGLATKGLAAKFCFILLPLSVWRSIAASMPPLQIPMGPSGLVATITDLHPDGSSIRPWTPPGLCLTRQWADSLKNAHPPRPKHESRSLSEPPHKRQRGQSQASRDYDGPPPPPGSIPCRSPSPARSAAGSHLPPSLHQRRVSLDRASMASAGRSPSPSPSEGRASHRGADDGRHVPHYYRDDRRSDAGSFRAPWEEYEVTYSQHDSHPGYKGPGGM